MSRLSKMSYLITKGTYILIIEITLCMIYGVLYNIQSDFWWTWAICSNYPESNRRVHTSYVFIHHMQFAVVGLTANVI